MYKVEDLFDKRSVVGSKLEQILREKGETKAKLCKNVGISRPTINKMLAGTLTSKTNYEKHIEKVLKYLETTPDRLLGNVVNSHRRIRQIRKLMRIATEEVAHSTGISLERLEQIEAGEESTVAELRDIALCLSVSVRSLSGENIFETQVATMNDFTQLNKVKETSDLSGFWGHVGILLSNIDRYLWYPITGAVRSDIYKMIDNKRVIIPCMNNKLLFLYMPNVKEVVLLDGACDTLGFSDLDLTVSEGEIPLVVYDALEDYIFMDSHGDDDRLSPQFKDFLRRLIVEKKWASDEITSALNDSVIYYADGKSRVVEIEFNDNDTVSSEIFCIYTLEDSDRDDNMLFFTDLEGVENFINITRISMLELPLLKVEKGIADSYNEV